MRVARKRGDEDVAWIDVRSLTEVVATGQRHVRLTASREQGTEHDDRRAH
jgi:hypothetical protein